MKINRLIVIGFAVLMIIGVVGMINTSGKEKVNEEQNYSITDVANTVIAEITLTANAITPTNEPTNTPEPTPTNSEVAKTVDYLDIQAERAERCSSSLETLSSSFTQMGNNPSLLLDQSYMDMVDQDINDFELDCTNLAQENPPSLMKTTNDYLILADTEYQNCVDDLRYGLDNLDVDYLNNAIGHMEQGSNYILLVTEELENFTDLLPE